MKFYNQLLYILIGINDINWLTIVEGGLNVEDCTKLMSGYLYT